jgi:hypothetical protein
LLGFLVGVWLPGQSSAGGGSYNPLRTLAAWVRGGSTPGTAVTGTPLPQPVMGDVCQPDPEKGKVAAPDDK